MTMGNWMKEHLRCYVVYGASALISIAGLWLLGECHGHCFLDFSGRRDGARSRMVIHWL
jgi:hypothetical protein